MKSYITIPVAFGLLVMSSHLMAQEQSLSRQDVIKKVLEGNRTLHISRIENNKAATAVSMAQSMQKPTVSGTGQYLLYAEHPVIFLRDGGANPKVSGVEVGGRNSLAAAVTANYPIINPVLKNGINRAMMEAEIQKEKTTDLEKTLVSQALQIYLTIVLYQEQKELLQQSRLRNEQALKDSRALFLQGKGLKTDTLRNYIAMQNLQAGISLIQSQIEVQLLQLKQLTGLGAEHDIRLTDGLADAPEGLLFIRDSLTVQALQNREDLRIQRLIIEDTKLRLKTARADYKPQLSAIAQYGIQAQSDKVTFWNFAYPRTSFVGLQLAVPIYSAGRARLKTMQINDELQQSQVALAELESRVSTDLASIQADLAEAHRQRAIQIKNVEAAQVNYEMVKDRYQYGLSNRLELTDAELALTQAKIKQVESLYTINITELHLLKAAGLLVPGR